jgi:hypothetical protein
LIGPSQKKRKKRKEKLEAAQNRSFDWKIKYFPLGSTKGWAQVNKFYNFW